MITMYLAVITALLASTTVYARENLIWPQEAAPGKVPVLDTNIHLFGSDVASVGIRHPKDVVINPADLIEQAKLDDGRLNDIQEDEDDRFITTRSGKLRPRFEPDANQWAEEPRGVLGKMLSRKKRCGGGGGGDDDDNANRSRRSRRARRVRKTKKKKVTTYVLQNGQLIPTDQIQQQQQVIQEQPMIIQQQQPMVQTIQPQACAQQQQMQQPQIIQQTQPQMIHQTQPMMQTQQPQQQQQMYVQQQQPQVVQMPAQQQQQEPTVQQAAPAAQPMAPNQVTNTAIHMVQPRPTVSAENSVKVSL